MILQDAVEYLYNNPHKAMKRVDWNYEDKGRQSLSINKHWETQVTACYFRYYIETNEYIDDYKYDFTVMDFLSEWEIINEHN